MKYLIKLKDGTTFIAERPWYYQLAESGCWSFKDVQGKNNPTNGKDKIHIPKASILYVVEQRR